LLDASTRRSSDRPPSSPSCEDRYSEGSFIVVMLFSHRKEIRSKDQPDRTSVVVSANQVTSA
jgi:hypothetical protein